MVEISDENVSDLSDRSVAVALITVGRYLSQKDVTFIPYLKASLEHATASKLAESDLAMLRLMIGSLG